MRETANATHNEAVARILLLVISPFLILACNKTPEKTVTDQGVPASSSSVDQSYKKITEDPALSIDSKSIEQEFERKLDEGAEPRERAMSPPERMVRKARRLLKNGEAEESIKFSSKAISLDPKMAEAYVKRADAYFVMEKFNESLADCNEAIRLKPEYLDAIYRKGCALAGLRRPKEALKDLNFVLAKQKDRAMAYAIRAEIKRNTGDYRSAIADFNSFIENAKSISEKVHIAVAYLHSAQCAKSLGDRKLECELLTELLERDDGNKEALILRGDSYRSLLKWTSAIADYRSAMAIDPEDQKAKEGLRLAEAKISVEKKSGNLDKNSEKPRSEKHG